MEGGREGGREGKMEGGREGGKTYLVWACFCRDGGIGMVPQQERHLSRERLHFKTLILGNVSIVI